MKIRILIKSGILGTWEISKSTRIIQNRPNINWAAGCGPQQNQTTRKNQKINKNNFYLRSKKNEIKYKTIKIVWVCRLAEFVGFGSNRTGKRHCRQYISNFKTSINLLK